MGEGVLEMDVTDGGKKPPNENPLAGEADGGWEDGVSQEMPRQQGGWRALPPPLPVLSVKRCLSPFPHWWGVLPVHLEGPFSVPLLCPMLSPVQMSWL